MNISIKKYNNIAAWLVFSTALITYVLTLEPSVSFWDCGEFISSAFKLEVGHPPGAPLYILIGRLFSLFTADLSQTAFAVNLVSAIAGAFTIFFLYHTIAYFANKILQKIKPENNYINSVTVIISASAGSLSYAFSDTFWFSAVEAEVYSLSSLFTAFVFWAILKWEQQADQKYSNRIIILIAYVMGLSIGVHLLNLLAVPAIVFVYYFKKYKISKKGIIYASLISITILAFVLYGIIQGYFIAASKFELLFVNIFGFNYNSGLYFFLIITFVIASVGIYYTHKKIMPVANTIILSITVILTGYSSYALIFIRSAANTPMNENKPDNVFSLLSYLNRDQYGSRPLIWGEYYDADFKRDDSGNIYTENKYTYIPENGKYIKIKKTNPEYFYNANDMTFFPRMYSRENHHISAYKTWGGTGSDQKPHFINNLLFFAKYQLGQMYFRYFMWNFAGRQNDIQGYGHFLKGNWISGFPFIDSITAGPQHNLPDRFKNNTGRNKYFLIPLILGIAGLIFAFSSDKNNFVIVLLLFFFTGIAIVMYLNQTPYQPRERDYAYAGSLYAFSVWIGIGITAVFVKLTQFFNNKISLTATFITALSAPAILFAQNLNDHNRANRYIARDFAKNYLNSCDKNAILFTFGDNDTFPLWYIQEVEGYRTDVKVVNLSLLGTDWYINQMRTKTNNARPVPFNMPKNLYREGERDAVYLTDNFNTLTDEKYYASITEFKPEFEALYNKMFTTLQNSDFPAQNPKEFEVLKTNKHKISPLKFAGIVSEIYNKNFITKFNINKTEADSLAEKTDKFIQKISMSYLPLDIAMKFLASDTKNSKLAAGTNDEICFIPSKSFSLKVNKQNVLKSGKFNKIETQKFKNNIYFNIDKNYIYKNQAAVLEILAANNWERPIYFATSGQGDEYLGLEEYFRLDGFAYKLVPFKPDKDKSVSINSDILFDKLMNEFVWGNIQKPNVLTDENIIRVLKISEIQETFLLLAEQLADENKFEKAVAVCDKYLELFPDRKVPFDKSALRILKIYQTTGNKTKLEYLSKYLYKIFKKEFEYYNSLKGNKRMYTNDERLEAEKIYLTAEKILKNIY